MANDSLKPKSKSKRGGARPGAGRKKGKLEPHTIEVRKAKERFMARVAKSTDKLFNAQLNKAVGEHFLMRKVTERDSKGKITRTYHEIVTNPKKIIEYLDSLSHGEPIDDDNNYYYITTRSADNSAISDMLNRGLGKPTEHVEADLTSKGQRITSINESQLAQLIRARSERSNT